LHENDRFLNVDAVAALFDVPRKTIHEWIAYREDPLPSYKLGKHRRFVLFEVLLWAQHRRTPVAVTRPTDD
jgi:excisionase family DNA binding protein